MNAPAEGGGSGHTEGSQLGTLRRIRLLYRKPRDAFSLLSLEERKRDAVLVLLLCYAVRLPVVLQRSYAQGHFERGSDAGVALAIVVGAVLGFVLLVAACLLLGFLLHLVFNIILKARRPVAEALTIPFLSLAPQILLVFELPTLFFRFQEAGTFRLFVLLRLFVTLLTLRSLFWGVRGMWRRRGESPVKMHTG